MTQKDSIIWAEMARRKLAFHKDENWQDIKLWGLFQWGFVSHLIKTGQLITNMKKENKTIWVRPSEKAYNDFILPLLRCFTLKELEKKAGWD